MTALNQQVPCPGAEMVLLSLEEWTSSFTIRWFFAAADPNDETDLRLQSGLTWRLMDDQGNSYRGGDYGGGGGNSPHWRMTSYFAPPLNAETNRLTIEVTSPVNGELLATVISLRK